MIAEFIAHVDETKNNALVDAHLTKNMKKLRSIVNVFVFVITGIIAIIVGSFMLRGNMHMWDKNSKEKNGTDDKP